MKTRIAVILVAVLFLQGCGLKFWYNRLDWVVPWYVDDFVELTEPQEQRLEDLLVRQTQWHRQQELPKYVAFLEVVRQDITDGTVVENYYLRRLQMSSFYETLVAQMAPQLSQLMISLNESQMESLLKNLKEQDQDLLKERAEESAEERVEQIYQNIKDSIEDWTGRLTTEQRQVVKQWASKIEDTTQLRMAYRQEWREAVLIEYQLAKVDDNHRAFEDLIINADQFQSSQLKQAYRQNAVTGEQYISEIFSMLTDKQRKRLVYRIDQYIEDFNDLINDQ
ncbi:DUF6279 family lipoprotein [Pleionea litopenaei]|uniref:DUF6279 family lipoprotein n=1 Tax=Pleionea litopenaei TaxID=3070815 RepID=A0AA51X791_9GAMM|nr:DUF6279 family lipoprotein [Pleionea sp. HL-JVS1]WMS86860.1 DUF6279 family lipoprotein [Pleionea sp. HL-JVS1]